MDQEQTNSHTENQFASLRKVTPVSKYLAMLLFVSLPFLGGWIGYQYGVIHNQTVHFNSAAAFPIDETQRQAPDTSLLIGDILKLDRSKVWTAGYATNQMIAGEYGYSADIVSGILLYTSTDVEGGRADTFATSEGAEYIRLVTTFLKEQGYDQVDFYEGRPGSFGSLFKLSDGLYLKLRGWTIGRDVRVEEQGDFFGSVPVRYEYEILITDTTNPLSIDQDVAVDQISTDALVPEAKIFFSNRHGVVFTYVSSPCSNDFSNPWSGLVCTENQNGLRVSEERDRIYIGDQYISVYQKDPQMTLQAAIVEQFITEGNADECSFEAGNVSLPEQYQQVRVVPGEYGDNSCKVNPSGVFVMNPEVPDKYIYVIVGQEPYLPSGSVANPSEMWQESIRITD